MQIHRFGATVQASKPERLPQIPSQFWPLLSSGEGSSDTCLEWVLDRMDPMDQPEETPA